MTEKRILFDGFEFPRLGDMEYLMDEGKPSSDYLFINNPYDGFTMYFEKGFPVFAVSERAGQDYCLLEIKRPDRRIRLFCPERSGSFRSALWYFYVELEDGQGGVLPLTGQIRVDFGGSCLRTVKGKPQFIEVLEQVQLAGTELPASSPGTHLS